MIWFLEGQSSLREVVGATVEALAGRVNVIASHRQCRPEITGAANLSLREPRDNAERIAWILEKSTALGVRVVHACRAGRLYESARPLFEEQGLILVTGALSVETFDQLDDKAVFTQRCVDAGIPVARGQKVTTAEGLENALTHFQREGAVCVKPTHGIYGQGFWKIREDADPFACLADADARVVERELFVDAYRRAANPKPLLVMQFLPGAERSADVVCEAGRIVAAVIRRKVDGVQVLEQGGRVMALVEEVVSMFKCDGLINVQTKDDEEGNPHLLEINPRPSGGIGYTLFSGINLPAIFALRRLGLPEPAHLWRGNVLVRPVNSATVVDHMPLP